MSYLDSIQKVAYRLPLESVTNLLVIGMHEKEFLVNPDPSKLISLNDESIDTVVRAALRAVSAYFIFPKVSPVVASINGCIGASHLVIGVIQRFKTTDPRTEGNETWNAIDSHLRKGFAHLFTAGYDFGIGYLLKQKYIGIGGAAAFALIPSFAKEYHDKVFKSPTPPKEEKEAVKPEIEKKEVSLVPTVEEVVEKVEQIITPPRVTPKEYLDASCLIYRLADRFTYEIMPPVVKEASREVQEEEKPALHQRIWGTIRRVSGYGDAPAKEQTAVAPEKSTSEDNPE